MPSRIFKQDAPVTTGYINAVNDPVIGMPAVPGGLGISKFAGFLGACLRLNSDQIRYLNSVGTIYGGCFQYVRFAAADAAFKQGQVVFWDLTAAENTYQVTVNEANAGAAGALTVAGIVINPTSGPGTITPGNYGWIQWIGRTNVLFRAVLSGPSSAGVAVFAAAAGAGADNATADVIDTAGIETQVDMGQQLERYLGKAVTAPVGGALSLVELALGING